MDHAHSHSAPACGLTRRGLLAGLGCAGAVAGCTTTNPATGRSTLTGFTTVQDDARIGAEEHPKVLEAFGGEYENRRVQSYVDGIGRRLIPYLETQQFRYRFYVLNTPVVNAMALPGGYIYITRGLLALANNEAELAGVLGHEMGHVIARHSAERMTQGTIAQIGLIALAVLGGQDVQPFMDIAQLGALAVIQGYSRSQEFEADTLGVRYMARAGYDPDGMVTLLATLEEHSALEARRRGLDSGRQNQFDIMATHPRAQDRVRAAIGQALSAQPRDPLRLPEPYLAAIDGILYGDDPEQGIVRGTVFEHGPLQLRFEVPDGFVMINQPDKVVAIHPDGGTIVFDMADDPNGLGPEAHLRRVLGRETPLQDIESIRVNGLPAATGVTQGRTSDGPADVRFVLYGGWQGRLMRFVFITPTRRTGPLARALRQTTYSFERLGRAEAAQIRPLVMDVVRVRQGDTLERLARGLPYGRMNETWFRMLNDLRGARVLQPGMQVKVVRGA